MYHAFNNVGYISSKLSKESMKTLNGYIKKAKKKDYRHTLAGNISESYQLKDTKSWFFKNDLVPLIKEFFENTAPVHKVVPQAMIPQCGFTLHDLWVNFQKKYEFNPSHMHGGVFSFVVWMKIPASYKEEIKLPFVKGANGMCPNTFELNYISTIGKVMCEKWFLEPEDEGTILFFDSNRPHQVYPFYTSDEKRISISGNISLTPIKDENFKLLKLNEK